MPPAGRFLLDTNIVIALFADEPPVIAAVRTAETVLLPAIVLGELYYGARQSARTSDNLARLAALAATDIVLSCDAATAEVYGAIKAELRVRGTPIPENDVWIAASARHHGLTLATRDAHFESVAGLDLVSWR